MVMISKKQMLENGKLCLLFYYIDRVQKTFIEKITTINNQFVITHKDSEDNFFDQTTEIHYSSALERYFFYVKDIIYVAKTPSGIIEEYNMMAIYYKMKKDIMNTFDIKKFSILDKNDHIEVYPVQIVSYRKVTFFKPKDTTSNLYDVNVDYLPEHIMLWKRKQTYSKASDFFPMIKTTQIKAYIEKLKKLNFDFFDVKFDIFDLKIYIKDHPLIKIFLITVNSEGVYKINVLNQVYSKKLCPSFHDTIIQNISIEIPEEMTTFTDINDLHLKINNIIEMFTEKVPQIEIVKEDVGIVVLNKQQLEKIKKNIHIFFT